MSATEMVVRLDEERSTRLHELARTTGAIEEELVTKAVDMLLGLTDSGPFDEERGNWQSLGAKAMQRVWDNDSDAVYDNWRELYGVAEV